MTAVFEILSAWNALLFLFAGLSVAGVGVALGAFALYLRSIERRFDGEIVAVRKESAKDMFWPVVAYIDETGRRREVPANSGSNLIAQNLPGTKVTVCTYPAFPGITMMGRDWWLTIGIAAFLIACGTPFLWAGISDLHFDLRTALVALVMTGAAAFKLRGSIEKLLNAWRENKWPDMRSAIGNKSASDSTNSSAGPVDAAPLSAAEIAAARAQGRKQTAAAAPILMLLGAAILAGGLYWLQHERAFEATAMKAEGTVVRNDEGSDSDGTTMYHAIVRFTDGSGNEVEHRDNIGASRPSYREGDKVAVLYAPKDSSSAMIDRGYWNWLVPALVAALGALLVAGGLAAQRSSER